MVIQNENWDKIIEKLNDKEKLFVMEYLVDLNKTQAVIRAGYSPRSAESQACRLMKKPAVKDAIDIAMAERSKRTGITADRVLMELAKIGFVNPGDFMNLDTGAVKKDASPYDTAAISSIKIKKSESFGETGSSTSEERSIGFHNKTKALELMGKHVGLFDDSVKIDIKDIPQIIDNDPGGDYNG